MLSFIRTHWIAILITLIPLAINIAIFSYIYFKRNKKPIHTLFSLLLIFLSLWEAGAVLIRISETLPHTKLWFLSLNSCLALLMPFGLHFALLFTRKLSKSNGNVLLLLIYFPGLLFFVLNTMGFASVYFIKNSFWGYIVVQNNTPFNYIYSSWISLLTLITLGILFSYTVKMRKVNRTIYKQSLLISLGLSIPALQGILTELMFPLVFDLIPIPLTSSFITFFSIAIFIALTRYQLFSYSPVKAWPSIIKYIREGILILDMDKNIKYINKQAKGIFALEKNALLNKRNISELLQNYQGLPQFLLEIDSSNKPYYNKSGKDLLLTIRENKKVWINLTVTSYKNEQNESVGYICIICDISHRMEHESLILDTIIDTQEQERKKIAHELHEEVCQELAATKIMLESSGNNKQEELDVASILGDSLSRVRRISTELMPTMLEKKSIYDLFHELGSKYEKEILLKVKSDLPNGIPIYTIKLSLYRITHELLHKTSKTFKESKVSILLRKSESNLNYDYYLYNHAVNGVNILSEQEKDSGIYVRVKSMDGSLKLHKMEGIGIRINIVVPLNEKK